MTLARNWWVLALRGTIAIVFGVVAFARPSLTLGALVILFGAYALVFGVILVALGFRLRNWGKTLPSGGGIPAPAH